MQLKTFSNPSHSERGQITITPLVIQGFRHMQIVELVINGSSVKLDEKSWNRFQNGAIYLLKRFRKYYRIKDCPSASYLRQNN